jgi:hypothetical protein
MIFELKEEGFSKSLSCSKCGWNYEWRHKDVLEVEIEIAGLTDLEWNALGYYEK